VGYFFCNSKTKMMKLIFGKDTILSNCQSISGSELIAFVQDVFL